MYLNLLFNGRGESAEQLSVHFDCLQINALPSNSTNLLYTIIGYERGSRKHQPDMWNSMEIGETFLTNQTKCNKNILNRSGLKQVLN